MSETTESLPNTLDRREWIQRAAVFAGTAGVFGCSRAPAAEDSAVTNAVARGRSFLVSLLDTEINLLPEYRGANVYWLFHDNYLASKVLASTNPEVAATIDNARRSYGVLKSGKIEILFNETEKPLPFRQYNLIDVKQVGNKTIRTEVAGDKPLEGWQSYVDLLLLAAIAQAQTAPAEANQNFDAAIAMWDGHGFNDLAARTANLYATYKLALALIAAEKLHSTLSLQDALLERLLKQQARDGGWITDYDAKGNPNGLANVETTSMAILALSSTA